MPWTGALHRSGISLLPRGREFRRRSCKSLLRTSLTFIYKGNSKGSIVHATEIALSWDCAPVPRYLEIAHRCHAILRLRKPSEQSRDWHAISGFWECAAQSRDCANSQIARNIYIGTCYVHVMITQYANSEIRETLASVTTNHFSFPDQNWNKASLIPRHPFQL